MIIINQDRDELINYRNIQNIYCELNGIVVAGTISGYRIPLGRYEDDQRAKEIIREIAQYRIKSYKNLIKMNGVYKTEDLKHFQEHIQEQFINNEIVVDDLVSYVQPLDKESIYLMPEK